eukprot:Opistho-1_new@99151
MIGDHEFLRTLARLVPLAFVAGRPEVTTPVALDRIDDPRDGHAAAVRQRLLPHPARQQHEIDRLRDEQHHRDRKNELADKAFGPQPQFHAAGPIRLTSHASV